VSFGIRPARPLNCSGRRCLSASYRVPSQVHSVATSLAAVRVSWRAGFCRLSTSSDFPINHATGFPVKSRVPPRMRHMTYVVDNRAMEPGTVAIFPRHGAWISTNPRCSGTIGGQCGILQLALMSADRDLEAVLFEPDPDNIELVNPPSARARTEKGDAVRSAAQHAKPDTGALRDGTRKAAPPAISKTGGTRA